MNDREDVSNSMFGAYANANVGPSGKTFEQAVELAKVGGWPVVIHIAGDWAICDEGGNCQIRVEMLDRDDSREYWA